MFMIQNKGLCYCTTTSKFDVTDTQWCFDLPFLWWCLWFRIKSCVAVAQHLKVSALPLQCHVAESYKINAISQTDIMQLNSAVKSFTKILIGAASCRYSAVMYVLKFMGYQFLFHFRLCNSNRHIVYGVSIPFVFRVVQQSNLNKVISFMGISSYGSVSHRY